jgi:hypothetical protein
VVLGNVDAQGVERVRIVGNRHARVDGVGCTRHGEA